MAFKGLTPIKGDGQTTVRPNYKTSDVLATTSLTSVTATAAEVNALHSQGAVAADFAKLHAITATANELNVNAGVTAGTVSASKTVVVDSNKAIDTLTVGGMYSKVTAATAAGVTVGATDGFLAIDTTSNAVACTVAAPSAGRYLRTALVTKGGSNTATLKTTAGTFDGTNNTATFATAGQFLALYGISATRWIIVANVGTVTLSST